MLLQHDDGVQMFRSGGNKIRHPFKFVVEQISAVNLGS